MKLNSRTNINSGYHSNVFLKTEELEESRFDNYREILVKEDNIILKSIENTRIHESLEARGRLKS
jgi:hypothetical protein